MDRRLSLRGPMADAVKIQKIKDAIDDKNITSIFICAQKFDNPETCDVTRLMIELLNLHDRQWNEIDFALCRNKLHLLLGPILKSNSVLRLKITHHYSASSSTAGNTKMTAKAREDEAHADNILRVLGRGLIENSSLVRLDLYGIAFTEERVKLLCQPGISSMTSRSPIEVEFCFCRFVGPKAHSIVGKNLRTWSSTNTIAFMDCYLTDTQVAEVLHLLIDHPNLRNLGVRGNQCMEQSGAAIIQMMERNKNLLNLDISSLERPRNITDDTRQEGQQQQQQHNDDEDFCPMLAGVCEALPSSQLQGLNLAVNDFSSRDMSNLATALSTNRSLNILYLGSCDFPIRPQVTAELADSLCHPHSTLKVLDLSDCSLTDQCLEALSLRLSRMSSIKVLDLGRYQEFTQRGIEKYFLPSIRDCHSVELEEIAIEVYSIKAVDLIHFFCDTNRGGKRFLQKSCIKTDPPPRNINDDDNDNKEMINHYPTALWPLIFFRILNTMKLPTKVIPQREGEASHTEDFITPKTADIRRASVTYYLLLNGALVER